jgi:hypothetical protein
MEVREVSSFSTDDVLGNNYIYANKVPFIHPFERHNSTATKTCALVLTILHYTRKFAETWPRAWQIGKPAGDHHNNPIV